MGREAKMVETEYGPLAKRVVLDSKIEMIRRARQAYVEAGIDVDAWLERLKACRARLYEALPRVGL